MDLRFAFEITGLDPKTIVIGLLVIERIIAGVRHYRNGRGRDQHLRSNSKRREHDDVL
jgi:hypothetical protein